jgi:hypothetical protein
MEAKPRDILAVFKILSTIHTSALLDDDFPRWK